jgi:glycosyltransferase involved in cell wall biosynthesis
LARLDPRKGLPILLQAVGLALSKLPEATLLIGGDGEERATLERRARELGLAGRVEFAGPVHDPPAFYRRCDLFALPSLDEGFGLVVLEAMASGLPVIGTRVGGVPELIEHDRNGLLVEPGDAPAIAEALRTLWADPARRARLAEAGRSTAARFTSARAAALTQAVYEALA